MIKHQAVSTDGNPNQHRLVLDHGYVRLIEHWGSDERIIEAARMSTDKGFQGWGPVHATNCGAHPDFRSSAEMIVGQVKRPCTCEPKPGDEKLLKFFYDHRHHTPFEMAGMIIEVQAPIFVFREWHRHRTQSYNELSARYTALPDLFYLPSIERIMHGKQATVNKQSSEGGFDARFAAETQIAIMKAQENARLTYDLLLKAGIAREIARIVIPVSQYSRMRASANLRNWLAFLTLRMDPAAQWEIQQFANLVGDLIAEKFPRTWQLFNVTGPIIK